MAGMRLAGSGPRVTRATPKTGVVCEAPRTVGAGGFAHPPERVVDHPWQAVARGGQSGQESFTLSGSKTLKPSRHRAVRWLRIVPRARPVTSAR